MLIGLSLCAIANAAEPLVTAVANAASYGAGSVSPGQMVVIFGVRLGPPSLTSFQLDAQGGIATSLVGIQVTFDGIPAPLLYVSQAQVAAVVPYALSGRTNTQIRVLTPEETSPPFPPFHRQSITRDFYGGCLRQRSRRYIQFHRHAQFPLRLRLCPVPTSPSFSPGKVSPSRWALTAQSRRKPPPLERPSRSESPAVRREYSMLELCPATSAASPN